jgi:hypothetical protein
MKKIIFLFTMSFLLCTCTKFGKNVTIKGRVLNPITGEGIPNVELELLRGTGGLPGGYKSVKSTKTDASGNFEISKGGLSTYSLACRVSSDYYQIGWIKDGVNVTQATGNLNIKKGKTMHVDYHAVPYGELSLNIKNENCTSSNDLLKLYFDGGLYDGYTFNSGLITTLSGCIDIPGTPVKSTIGKKYFHWEVTKNGITNTVYDTIFVEPIGITTLNIFY